MPHMITRISTVALLLLSANCMAEKMYVTDILQLSLYANADATSSKITTVASGAELTVLEQARSYTKVKTDEGVTGWAKTAYLVSEVPARLRATRLESSNKTLASQLEKTQQQFAELQNETTHLRSQQESFTTRSEQQEKEVSHLRSENSKYRDQLGAYENSVPISVLAGLAIACLLTGLAGGIAWLDYRSRKRHGGFRIY